jgi:hypothetical protein
MGKIFPTFFRDVVDSILVCTGRSSFSLPGPQGKRE